MAGYTRVNLKSDVKDMAPEFGMEGIESRFARTNLELENSGLSYFRLDGGFRTPFGHTHSEQEEVYVVVSGSARVAVGDEVVELGQWDADPDPERDDARHGGGRRRRRDPRVRRAEHGQQGRRDAAGLVARGRLAERFPGRLEVRVGLDARDLSALDRVHDDGLQLDLQPARDAAAGKAGVSEHVSPSGISSNAS